MLTIPALTASSPWGLAWRDRCMHDGSPYPLIDDDLLVRETLAGSQLAFGMLVSRHEQLVYRIGYRHAQCEHSAMDLCQNVFLKLYQRLASYQGAGSFKGWLIRLAHNECVDWLRRQRQDHQDLDDLDLAATTALPDAEQARAEKQRMVQHELSRLNEKQRLAINLRYFEQYSLSEIAEVLACSEGTAKNLLFRALSKLRDRVAFQRSECDV